MTANTITEEQKTNFENQFKELISKEADAQKKWDGQFNWSNGKPQLSHVIEYLTPRSRDKFGILLNKLTAQ